MCVCVYVCMCVCVYLESAIVLGKSHETLAVEKGLNLAEVEEKLKKVLESGIKSLAVVFLHSYTYPKHEEMVKTLALGMGFTQVLIICVCVYV
jgi:5-oxoprolinase (ATP-hydrolysing)